MIVSVNWLKKFTSIDLPVQELAELIGTRLVEIEGIEDLSKKYKDVLVVKVVECREVEGSDHLSVTKVDDGGVWRDVERDANGLVQVVCGAPNVRAGMLAAWLPPASTVPETVGTASPFVLGARELRGYFSNGMLASAKELDLYDDHSEIIEVDTDVAPGSSFAETYELDDYLLDIENKSLTHRPDTFGIIGFAREVAGIQGQAFTTPTWLQELDPTITPTTDVEAPKVVIEDSSLSDRFSTIVLTHVNEIATSPLGMQTYLARSGVRPISAAVDITNYMMLLTGQPMHAYDYDKFLKVSGGVNEIHVRSARPNETLTLLDGRVVTMSEDDIVIAAGNTAIGLAGAMGGAETESDATTTRVLLEAATFDLYRLRAVQMRHGVFTEAITRFTKGVPAVLTAPVIAEATRWLGEHTGAQVASSISEAYPGRIEQKLVTVSVELVNHTLGTTLTANEIASVLTNVEIDASVVEDSVTTRVPSWRHDIVIAQDIIEEVGRLKGYDSVTPTLAERDMTAVTPSAFDIVRNQLRQTLVRAGANEVLTYSFVHGDMMQKAHQNQADAYRLTNSISPQLQYYRQSLTPSLLTAVHPNIKNGYEYFALFELNKFHNKRHKVTEEGVPQEFDSLGFVVTQLGKLNAAPFYEAKQHLEYVASSLGIRFVYEPLESDTDYPVTQPFEPKRSARVWNHDKTLRIGVIGEYKRSVQKAFKLPEQSAGFEISPAAIAALVAQRATSYAPLSRYPGVERDICLQVSADVPYQSVYDATQRAVSATGLETTVEPVDIYQPEDKQTKNITLRISLVSNKKTLTGEEVAEHMNIISMAITTATQGKVV